MPVTRSVLDKNERQTRPTGSGGGLVQSAVLADDADELDKLDMSGWEDLVWKREIEQKLKESCKEAMSPDCKWLTEEEVYGLLIK